MLVSGGVPIILFVFGTYAAKLSKHWGIFNMQKYHFGSKSTAGCVFKGPKKAIEK